VVEGAALGGEAALGPLDVPPGEERDAAVLPGPDEDAAGGLGKLAVRGAGLVFDVAEH
jgi:hypothetical protein